MPADNPPIVIERVLEVPPHTTIQVLVEGRVVQAVAVPEGRQRIYFCVGETCGSHRHGVRGKQW